jgi:hypothetical protein
MARFLNYMSQEQCPLADSSCVMTTKAVAVDHVLYRITVCMYIKGKLGESSSLF